MTSPQHLETVGPADPNAPVAQKFYTVLTALGSLVTVASTLGMITMDQAASLGQVATTGTAFVLAVGTAVASFRTKRQLGNGTFEAAPTPPPPPPALTAAESINTVTEAVADMLARTQQGITAAGDIASAVLPGGLPVTSALGPVSELRDAFLGKRPT